MAVDKKVPYSEPGAAGFEKESWGNKQNWQYGDTPALTSTTLTVTAAVTDVVVGFLDVIAEDGRAAAQNGVAATDRANYIASAAITIPVGETKEVPVYVQGHFEMAALTWDATYTTDAQKKVAFQGSVSPTILVSKGNFDSDAIYP